MKRKSERIPIIRNSAVLLDKTGMTIFRPKLSHEDVENVNKLFELVEWFLTHDEGTRRRYWNSRHILKILLIAGFVPKENFESGGISSFTKNTDCYTLQEFVTGSIMKKIRFLKTKGDGKIRKEDFKELLDGLYRTIDSYVTSVNQLGDDTLNEFNNNFYRAGFYLDSPSIEKLKLYLPKEKVHETIREIVENQLLDSRKSQLVATLWVSKSFLEVVACILCWLYLNWFNELYMDPFTSDARRETTATPGMIELERISKLFE